MKNLKILGLAAVAAMAMMAFAAGSASATTLEVNGTTTNASVTITASLENGTALLKDTAGFSQNTCTASHVHGATHTPFTTTYLTGDLTSLTFTGCTRPVTVHKTGDLEIHYTSGTNGTVYSNLAEVTVGSPIGTLVCKTGETTHLGTLTGVGAGGHATLHVNALINCGIISSAKWEATYKVTSPTGLGVSA